MNNYDEVKLASLLPIPADDANKYSRGKMLLFAGSELYPGAAILAAQASQRAGAGYTQVYTASPVVPLIQGRCPSVVVRPRKEITESDFVATQTNHPCAYVVGPGYDAGKKGEQDTTKTVLKKAKAPVLVDGGGLHALIEVDARALCTSRKKEGYATILTPHEGEAAILAKPDGLPIDDPAQLTYALALAYEAIVILKGPNTFISDGEQVFSLSQGSPALAKAGTGDVLSGIIGAFLAQGIDAFDSAVLGVIVHAKAGRCAAHKLTEISVTAEDVIAHIPEAFKGLLRFRDCS
ncbi:MAG: NAD(P)H-hydrate dehydratase [Raoultibacter sp.]|jgi:hydroxyethylthiazole kinase-like uncharacterized protein yjeF